MPQRFHRRTGSPSRLSGWLAAGLGLALLAGCASSSRMQLDSTVAAMDGTPVGPEISAFLSTATSGSIAQFAQSPWGANVSVIVHERYFAASGRTCAQLSVGGAAAAQGGEQPALACRVGDAQWQAQRLVTRVVPGGNSW
ncbi:DVU3141 family protein [Kushneria aurantia]|uniref:DVU3141 family protein n=1 Tax=Kushneria aurantia TaxID=504092 RepID=A0ABV6G3H8_9GAMM|nr:DVU3141 family protein [Kushneria aurantia]